jgi:hypothetical protein
MRLVEVDPTQRGLAAPASKPGSGTHNRVGAGALLLEKRRPRGSGQTIVVLIEPTREAETRVQRKGADEGARSVPPRFEDRRQRVHGLRKPEPGVVPDAVHERIAARQDVRV